MKEQYFKLFQIIVNTGKAYKVMEFHGTREDFFTTFSEVILPACDCVKFSLDQETETSMRITTYDKLESECLFMVIKGELE